MARKDPAFVLRLPAVALRKRLHTEAKARKWSLNTYLLHLIGTHPERAKA